MFNIIKHRKIYYIFSGILIILSAVSLVIYGLNFGIEFKGGSLMEITGEIKNLPDDLNINVQKTEKGAILRFPEVDEQTHQRILEGIEGEEVRFEAIGSVIGQELKIKTLWAIGTVLVAIILYIAWSFRRLNKSWQYGLLAVVALGHDVLIALGVFSFLKIEIGLAFVAALLTILGYSVNDTIVVFDRTRENLSRSSISFSETINQSVNQTLTRSINTSLTTLLVLLAIYFLGGETIKYFVLALIIGVIVGTYSSIFIASSLLVDWRPAADVAINAGVVDKTKRQKPHCQKAG